MNELFIQHVKSVVHSLLDHLIEGDTSRIEYVSLAQYQETLISKIFQAVLILGVA